MDEALQEDRSALLLELVPEVIDASDYFEEYYLNAKGDTPDPGQLRRQTQFRHLGVYG